MNPFMSYRAHSVSLLRVKVALFAWKKQVIMQTAGGAHDILED